MSILVILHYLVLRVLANLPYGSAVIVASVPRPREWDAADLTRPRI